jgi:1-deoxy-D-xylulose-5-phosphate synthase
VRAETVSAVSVTGGHLGAGLGVVELTVALHAVFDTPKDKIIWDVGHQCYPHKILTGRRDRIRTLRTGGGLSGFTKRKESDYDPFGAGHSSTSISAAVGFTAARELGQTEVGDCIAVIGDGAITGGMAYEAMNHAGALDKRMIVILNDNEMSIAPPVGAMSNYLTRLWTTGPFQDIRRAAATRPTCCPSPSARAPSARMSWSRAWRSAARCSRSWASPMSAPSTGTTWASCCRCCARSRRAPTGRCCSTSSPRRARATRPPRTPGQGPRPRQVRRVTGAQKKSPSNAPAYTKVFAQALIAEAEADDKIVAVTAAMPDGTGLNLFAERFPERCFDVAIAEQHGVTFCAGMAAAGLKPFCAIYSTFLQRGYDQIVHDVAIQHLPVRFAIDRAGLVGADGATHAGSFDIGYLGMLPGIVLMAAGDEAELCHMVATAAAIDDGPSAFRYPRGEGVGVEMPERGTPLEIGKGRIVQGGNQDRAAVLWHAAAGGAGRAEELDARGLSTTVADARFAKPLDRDLILRLAREHEAVVTIEEGAVGGFSSHVLHLLATEGMLDRGLRVRPMVFPDIFIDQDSPAKMNEIACMTAADIVRTALAALGSGCTAAAQA